MSPPSDLPPLEQVCQDPKSPYVCFGTCVDNHCVQCPSGFGHETSLWLLENCAQPTAFIYALSGVIVLFCLGLEVALLPRLVKARGPVRVILGAVQISQLALFCAAIAEIVQLYASPVYFVFIALCAWAISIAFTMTIVTYARIVYKVANTRFPEFRFKIVLASSISLLSFPFFFLGLPASSYRDDPTKHNVMTSVMILLVPMQLLLTGPMLLQLSSQLLATIKKTEANVKQALVPNAGEAAHSSSAGAPATDVGKKSQFSRASHADNANPRHSSSVAGTDLAAPPATATAAGATPKRIDALVKRLTLFRHGMIFVVVPSEVVFCVLVACLYLIWRLPFLWAIHGLLLVCLCLCNLVLTLSSSGSRSILASPTASKDASSKGNSNTGNDTFTSLSPTAAKQASAASQEVLPRSEVAVSTIE